MISQEKAPVGTLLMDAETEELLWNHPTEMSLKGICAFSKRILLPQADSRLEASMYLFFKSIAASRILSKELHTEENPSSHRDVLKAVQRAWTG